MYLKDLKVILDEAVSLGILGKENIVAINCEVVILEVSILNREEQELIDFLIRRKVEYKAYEKKSEKNKSIIIIGLE